jgi:hypothetical protein
MIPGDNRSSQIDRWRTWSTSIVLGCIPSALPTVIIIGLESVVRVHQEGVYGEWEDNHAPLIYYSNSHPSPRQPIGTHEPRRASTNDENIYLGLGGHG